MPDEPTTTLGVDLKGEPSPILGVLFAACAYCGGNVDPARRNDYCSDKCEFAAMQARGD